MCLIKSIYKHNCLVFDWGTDGFQAHMTCRYGLLHFNFHHVAFLHTYYKFTCKHKFEIYFPLWINCFIIHLTVMTSTIYCFILQFVWLCSSCHIICCSSESVEFLWVLISIFLPKFLMTVSDSSCYIIGKLAVIHCIYLYLVRINIFYVVICLTAL